MILEEMKRCTDGYGASEIIKNCPEFIRDDEVINLSPLFPGFDVSAVYMEDDVDCDHAAYISYYEDDSGDVSDWSPSRPSGDSMLINISDAENGPIAHFATPKC